MIRITRFDVSINQICFHLIPLRNVVIYILSQSNRIDIPLDKYRSQL